ncbi:uncharacterized protein LOC135129484 [Zophobas morio]|uniref:uncharacterized protein LOC135129484 n=1 Tax=Zophobas morio TaxID=2755281 RepID=UPI0030835154
MSNTTEMFQKEIDDLKFDFIVSVSVIGAACIFLLICVFGLLIWNAHLTKKIKNLDPFVNFKLQRPKLINAETPSPTEPPKNVYDNSPYPKNPMSQPAERRDLNPIAIRSKASFDNGNFIFGEPNNLSSNSFKNPDYLDQDSRFY